MTVTEFPPSLDTAATGYHEGESDTQEQPNVGYGPDAGYGPRGGEEKRALLLEQHVGSSVEEDSEAALVLRLAAVFPSF